jgi:hypothetical protein
VGADPGPIGHSVGRHDALLDSADRRSALPFQRGQQLGAQRLGRGPQLAQDPRPRCRSGFYEGYPRGQEHVPWAVWIGPLLFWGVLACAVSACLVLRCKPAAAAMDRKREVRLSTRGRAPADR